MAVPNYEKFMLPIIKLLGDGKVYDRETMYSSIAKELELSQEDMEETLPTQTQPTYVNRIGWAITYLLKAGLIVRPSRGHYSISKEGKKIISKKIEYIDKKFLMQYESFKEFQNISNRNTNESINNNIIEQTTTDIIQDPTEKFIASYEEIKKDMCDQLLEAVNSIDFNSFEKLVVDLMVAMKYAYDSQDAYDTTQRTRDEGIDGFVRQDPFGFNTVWIQAKHWKKNVGGPEIREFAGAVQQKHGKFGIFITTSSFTQDAKNAEKAYNGTIKLINGVELAELMYQYNLGVVVERTTEIKRLDSDYFNSF